MFVLMTSLKVVIAFWGVLLFIGYILWVIIALNNVFFEAHGFPNIPELTEAFYQVVLSEVLEMSGWIGLFSIILFFLGVYISKMLLRPFELIGDHCIHMTQGEQGEYAPNLFSEYRLLTHFSEFFFAYTRDVEVRNELFISSIPPQFQKIHGPTFEKVFFVHLFVLFGLIGLIVYGAVFFFTISIQENMVGLAIKFFGSNTKESAYFFQNQQMIFQTILYISFILVAIFYSLLSVHLYSKVSGAVFGFFATMRAFMKGQFDSRVHLLGFGHVRSQGRELNQYLKYLVSKYHKNEEK